MSDASAVGPFWESDIYEIKHIWIQTLHLKLRQEERDVDGLAGVPAPLRAKPREPRRESRQEAGRTGPPPESPLHRAALMEHWRRARNGTGTRSRARPRSGRPPPALHRVRFTDLEVRARARPDSACLRPTSSFTAQLSRGGSRYRDDIGLSVLPFYWPASGERV